MRYSENLSTMRYGFYISMYHSLANVHRKDSRARPHYSKPLLIGQ